MSNFKISYTPAFVNRVDIDADTEETRTSLENNIALIQKFEAHLKEIKAWQDRIESIEYLASNAKKLAGNISYKSVDEDVKEAITYFSGKEDEDEVDFDMFVDCVDILIDGYKQQALVGLLGESD
jgi:hypothetical protein